MNDPTVVEIERLCLKQALRMLNQVDQRPRLMAKHIALAAQMVRDLTETAKICRDLQSDERPPLE